jgi:hypothetical protein
MECLAGDPKLPRRLTYREFERGQHILAEDFTGVRWESLLPANG